MSEPDRDAENFLQRWSQRKRAAATRGRNEDATPDAAKTETGAPPGSVTATPPEPPAFDTKTLPPIESITANSDIRAFLAPGVPLELSRAALRRAWTSDPAIRDFIGLADNQCDFTKPDSVPGFGSLELTPELRQLLARIVGDAPGDPTPLPQTESPSGQATGTSAELPSVVAPSGAAAVREDPPPQPVTQRDYDAPAPIEVRDTDTDSPSAARKHGGALPKLADTRRY